MDKSLAEFAKAHGVKYFLINFTDLSGVQRSKLVPAAAIDEMQSAGAGFAGFAAYLDMTVRAPPCSACRTQKKRGAIDGEHQVPALVASGLDAAAAAGGASPPGGSEKPAGAASTRRAVSS